MAAPFLRTWNFAPGLSCFLFPNQNFVVATIFPFVENQKTDHDEK